MGRVLAVLDRSTPLGRRDHVVLVCECGRSEWRVFALSLLLAGLISFACCADLAQGRRLQHQVFTSRLVDVV